MDQVFQSADWYRALTLAERIASKGVARPDGPSEVIDADLADWRLKRWRSQSPFNGGALFAERLEVDDIGEDEFRRLLGEPAEALRDRAGETPAWLADIAAAFTGLSSTAPSPEPVGDKEWNTFLGVIEPLMAQGRGRLSEGLRALGGGTSRLPFDPAVFGAMAETHLKPRLMMMLMRTLALEVNVARLKGSLGGSTPGERFQAFFQSMRQPEAALAILHEYPVLARLVTLQIDRWVQSSLEFLQRLCSDWQDILSTFTPEADPGTLIRLDIGAGDAHRGGRSVVIAGFSSGFQVVYKPRSLAVDVHFQKLLTWLNERGSHAPFRTLKLIRRDTYGWVEHISPQSCTSREELHRFYERQGGYLALFYALEATDFHYENLIASGEHPVMVDLESLFHPRAEGSDVAGQMELPGLDALFYSVLRVGLLPQRIWAKEDGDGIDISGMGMSEGQLTPDGVPFLAGVNTDEMRIERKRVIVPVGSNRPALNGSEIQAYDYADSIATGFTGIYRLLLNHRLDLMRGPLADFAEDEVRVVFRPTRVYARLLQESFHPDTLGDAIDRDRFLDRLWVSVHARPYLKKVIQAELDDLCGCDIPFFSTRPGSRDVYTAAGRRIVEFFDESGLSLVGRRLEQLGEKDLDRQLWFIRASLSTSAMASKVMRLPKSSISEPKTIVTRAELLEAACAVGDRLDELAFHNDRGSSWLGLAQVKNQNWGLLPLSIDLYDGLAGVILFLAYLGDVTGQDKYTARAHSALATFQHLKDLSTSASAIGAFNGWGGVVYMLTHLGALWDDPERFAEAEEIVAFLPDFIARDEQLDLVGGAAGCIGSLLSACKDQPNARMLAVAVQCGDRLIATSKVMDQGRGWMTPIPAKKPLGGFSHGAAGMAWALLELATMSGEERFRTTALEAIAYERTLFDAGKGKWLDQRDFEKLGLPVGGGDALLEAWCHGSPGIGLARLLTLHSLDDERIRAEIQTALDNTLARGFDLNHCLCHGDLGNLELLLQAAGRLDDPALPSRISRTASKIVESIHKDGWLCGTPSGVESPGLMIGLAGIGYGLLRLAQPDRVPAVLTLAPPMRRVAGEKKE
jgi:type 2 lantibiotic biosynthesis protein LanM